jgi:hypothetical protein
LARLAAILSLALLLPSPAAAARGPSTAEERRRAVETTRKLEREPLARGSDEARRWLFQWITDIPDINVTSCSGPLDVLLEEEDGPYASILYVQAVFGMTAYLIENPKKAGDELAVQTAGIESVLRAYASILRADSEARWAELDALAKAQKAGKLRGVVERRVKCRAEGEGPAPEDAI